MIAETVGTMRIAEDDVIFAEVIENSKGKFSILVEQFDPQTETADNPSGRFLLVHERYLPGLIRLLQTALQRANSMAAR